MREGCCVRAIEYTMQSYKINVRVRPVALPVCVERTMEVLDEVMV